MFKPKLRHFVSCNNYIIYVPYIPMWDVAIVILMCETCCYIILICTNICNVILS